MVADYIWDEVREAKAKSLLEYQLAQLLVFSFLGISTARLYILIKCFAWSLA